MGLAVETSIQFIGGVSGVSHFVWLDILNLYPHIFRQFDCAGVLALWQRRAFGNTGEDVFSLERIDGHLQEEGAVDTAGIGDDDFAEFVQDLL